MVYKWYILPIGGLYATYHLLGEPGTTIERYTSLQVPFSVTLLVLLEGIFWWQNNPWGERYSYVAF